MSSEHKQDKGKKGGNCNRTACQKPGAEWFNHSTRSYYCGECAEEINRVNPEALAMYGHELCTREQPQEGKPLTADEAREKACAASAQDKRHFYTDVKSYMLGFYAGYDHVSNQSAALRDELEKTQQDCRGGWKSMHDAQMAESKYLKAELLDKGGELEAVKKERDQWKYAAEDAQRCHEERHIAACEAEKQLSDVTRQRDEAKREWQEMFDELKISIDKHNVMVKVADTGFNQRDEAVKLLEQLVAICERSDDLVASDLYHFIGNDYLPFKERLSSGETKPVRPWISVEDRLPERPNTTPNRFSPRVWVGNPKQDAKLEESDNYDFELGRWHRYGSRVKFWMSISPLPAPPESLTDKK